MKKILILILVLIIVFGVFTFHAQSGISASAERPEFYLDTFFGDPSSAEGLEIRDFIFMLQDEQYDSRKCYTWKADMRIAGGKAEIISMSSERDAIHEYLGIMRPWPEDLTDSDMVGRQSPSISDLNGKYVYKAYTKDGYYCLDVTDAATGSVLHTVTIGEHGFTGFDHEYPKLFAGRGSVVVAIVQDLQESPQYGWLCARGPICCVTADGKIISLPGRTYTFRGYNFYVAGNTGVIAASSNGDRFAVIGREQSCAIWNEAGEVIGRDFMPCSQAVWVFGPSGLEYMGLIRCSLEGVVKTTEKNDGSSGSSRWPFPYFSSYEMYTKAEW